VSYSKENKNNPLMKNLCLALSCFFCLNGLFAQERIVEVISPGFERSAETGTEGANLYIGMGNRPLGFYNGTEYSEIEYPIRDGRRLRYGGMVQNDNQVFLILVNSVTSERLLYQCNGSRLVLIDFPSPIYGNVVSYRGGIYAYANTSGGLLLCRYSAGVVTAIPGSLQPSGYDIHLVPTTSFLYVQGRSPVVGHPGNMKRYDGTSFISLPVVNYYNNELEAAYPRPGSDEVYFLLGVTLIYSDGRGTSTILVDNYETGEYAYSAQWYNDQFYFARNLGFDGRAALSRAEGSVTFPITIPGGALLRGYKSAVVVRDRLYLQVRLDVGSDHVFSFDGVNFEDVFTIPVAAVSPTLENRDGKLVITPSMLNDGVAYEYDPLEVITIRTPDEEHFEIVRKSTTCIMYGVSRKLIPIYLPTNGILPSNGLMRVVKLRFHQEALCR
jgi:hypothetical protein